MTQSRIAIKGLHHAAYRCRDSEETRAFYEDFLGLPLADEPPPLGHLLELELAALRDVRLVLLVRERVELVGAARRLHHELGVPRERQRLGQFLL